MSYIVITDKMVKKIKPLGNEAKGHLSGNLQMLENDILVFVNNVLNVPYGESEFFTKRLKIHSVNESSF